MGSLDDNLDDTVLSAKADILVPITADKTRILAPDNDAAILGVLHEIGLYLVRMGLFGLLFEHNAASVGTKIAVDSEEAIAFHLGRVKDAVAYLFLAPCPTSTEARIEAG